MVCGGCRMRVQRRDLSLPVKRDTLVTTIHGDILESNVAEESARGAPTANLVEKRLNRNAVRCPACRSDRVYRAGRRGLLQTRVLPMFGFYPWQCKGCGADVMIRRRDRLHRRITDG